MAAATRQEKQHGPKRLLTLNEAISMIEDDDNITSADIFIQPPSDGQTSDIDSGDEENVEINNLPGNQLQAPAEMRARARGTSGEDIVITQEDDDDAGSTSVGEATADPRKKRRIESLWRKEDIAPSDVTRATWDATQPAFLSEHLTPTSCFELFFDNDVIDFVLRESEKYALENGDHTFTASRDTFKLFLSILFISGYNPLPRRPLYWEQQDDVYNKAVSDALSRNSFDKMMKYLHLASNACLENNKFAKVLPLIRMLRERFQTFFPLEQNLSIDESMCPYFGKHGAKQCIRGKPIRFGFKQWVLATPLGYIVNIIPYQGAVEGISNANGLGYSVVEQLVSCLPPLPFHLSFDNFFTSLPLLAMLSEKNLGATGTVRSNRTGGCPLKDPNVLKKEPRGTFDYRHDRKQGIVVVGWNDNNVVTVASTKYGVNPLRKAKRWSARDKAMVHIDQPQLIKIYNCTMGGVDRADQNIGQYRIHLRSKKWWWPLFAFYCDAAAQNAWLLFRKSAEPEAQSMDQLTFKRSIVHVYLKRHKQDRMIGRPLAGRAPPMSKRVSDEVRKDMIGHHLQTGLTQRRCGYCGKKTKFICSKCSVPVHVECSQSFHL